MSNLYLRAVEPEDADWLFECDNDPECRIWTDYVAPLSRQQLLEYALTYDADPFRSRQLRLVAEIRDPDNTGHSLGIVDIYDIDQKNQRAFIGIYIIPQMRRMGYGTRVMAETIDYAKRFLALKKMVAKVSVHNGEAIKLFQKCGFSKIAVLPEWQLIDCEFHDILLFVRTL